MAPLSPKVYFAWKFRPNYSEVPGKIRRSGKGKSNFCVIKANYILLENLTEIGVAAFEHCYSLNRLEIPDSVVKI